MPPLRECMPYVLLVEDDPLWSRLFIADIGRQCRVEWTKTLAGARRLLDDRVFDLVVTDLQLGHRTSHELPSLARRHDPRTPVLLLSGAPSIAGAAAEIRPDAWLHKPVRLPVLRKAVSKLLARRRRTRRGKIDGPASTHGMALFDSDDQQLDTGSTFLAEGLRDGGRAVALIARRLHASMRALVLRKSGLDRLTSDFRLVVSETIAERVVVDGTASRNRLAEMAPDILGPLENPPARPLRLFGDAVGLLARRGDHRAAVQLEDLWNEALPPRGAQVLCSYSRDGLEAASCRCLQDLRGRHDPGARAV